MEYYKNKIILSDNDITFLAESYLKLLQDKTYKNLSKTFQDYIDEFLTNELIYLKRKGIIK